LMVPADSVERSIMATHSLKPCCIEMPSTSGALAVLSWSIVNAAHMR
jgi:hypothetical protein